MRVLFWSHSFWPQVGGAEVLAVRLLRALRERGHQFIVVTNKAADQLPDEAAYDGIPVFRFPFLSAILARDVEGVMQLRQRAAALKRAFRPDLIHLYLLAPSTMFLRLTSQVHPAPLLVTLHSEVGSHEEYRWIDRDTLFLSTVLSADWVTACSATVLGDTRRLLPQITHASSAIPNALEWPRLDAQPLSNDPPRLLCVGRLHPVKGFDRALTALAALLDRFPAATLTVAGDGPERAALQEQAAAIGVADAVEFRGWVDPDEVPALINTSTIVVVPSRTEGMPLVALQAAQMARPLVATRVAGLPELVVHGETGLLVEPEDSRALAQAIELLLEHPASARAMGQAARRRVRELFSWARHVDAYDALYRKLGKEGSSARAG
jgi:glycosyltransferase involved in cell wall biosynthesis